LLTAGAWEADGALAADLALTERTHLSVSDKVQERVGILLSKRFEHTITDV
jgi:hypothetical protein